MVRKLRELDICRLPVRGGEYFISLCSSSMLASPESLGLKNLILSKSGAEDEAV